MIELWLLAVSWVGFQLPTPSAQGAQPASWEQWKVATDSAIVVLQETMRAFAEEGRKAIADHERRVRDMEAWKVSYGKETDETLRKVLSEIQTLKSQPAATPPKPEPQITSAKSKQQEDQTAWTWPEIFGALFGTGGAGVAISTFMVYARRFQELKTKVDDSDKEWANKFATATKN
jgi:hypothetical protein